MTKKANIMRNDPHDNRLDSDATAPTVTIDYPPDLTPRRPEPTYVIIRTDDEGDIESARVADGFYCVESLALDIARVLAQEQPGSRFFVATIRDPGVFAFCAPRKLARQSRRRTCRTIGEPIEIAPLAITSPETAKTPSEPLCKRATEGCERPNRRLI